MNGFGVIFKEQKFSFDPNEQLSHHVIHLAEIKDHKCFVLSGPPCIREVVIPIP